MLPSLTARKHRKTLRSTFKTCCPSRLVVIRQRVCVSTADVRSDLSGRQSAGRNVSTENVNIVADEADGASSGALPVSAFALEFGAN